MYLQNLGSWSFPTAPNNVGALRHTDFLLLSYGYQLSQGLLSFLGCRVQRKDMGTSCNGGTGRKSSSKGLPHHPSPNGNANHVSSGHRQGLKMTPVLAWKHCLEWRSSLTEFTVGWEPSLKECSRHRQWKIDQEVKYALHTHTHTHTGTHTHAASLKSDGRHTWKQREKHKWNMWCNFSIIRLSLKANMTTVLWNQGEMLYRGQRCQWILGDTSCSKIKAISCLCRLKRPPIRLCLAFWSTHILVYSHAFSLLTFPLSPLTLPRFLVPSEMDNFHFLVIAHSALSAYDTFPFYVCYETSTHASKPHANSPILLVVLWVSTGPKI